MKQKTYGSLYIDAMRRIRRLNKSLQVMHQHHSHAVNQRSSAIDVEEMNNIFITHGINNNYY